MAVGQLAAALGYLLYVVRFFTRIRPLIVTTRLEWRDDVLSLGEPLAAAPDREPK